MSKKSSARTGSEGDADAASRISSYKSKKGQQARPDASFSFAAAIEAGPYGDSPSDQQTYQDCFFYMLQENDDSSGDEDAPELYSLQNDYLEKLNALRKRLNLIELADDEETCTVTEIIEERPESSTTESENLEIKTLHPFSVCYNFEAQSITNILELEYNPPKKKSCFRLRTPKLPSASESNLPYHTKVSLREDLFQKASHPERISKECYDKFTRTQETQVEEADVESEPGEPSEEDKNVNLFPTVIVAAEPLDRFEVAGVSAASSLDALSCRVASDGAAEEQLGEAGRYPLNFVEESSNGSYTTVTTSTTIVESPKTEPKERRNRLSFRTAKSCGNQLSMWEELAALKPANEAGQGERARQDVVGAGQERRRAKSSPIERVPFGPVLLNERNLDARCYLFGSSSPSEEEEERYSCAERCASGSSGAEEGAGGTFWDRLVGCFRPVFGFIGRRR